MVDPVVEMSINDPWWKNNWARVAISEGVKPHMLGKTTNGILWEYISYPWVENNKIMVKIRVPGDPTTIRDGEWPGVQPEKMRCHCDIAERVTGSPDFWYRNPKHLGYQDKTAWR